MVVERLLAEGHFIGASCRGTFFLTKAAGVGESSAPAMMVSESTVGL